MGNAASFRLSRKRSHARIKSSSLGLDDSETTDTGTTASMATSVYTLNQFFTGHNLEAIADFMSRCDDPRGVFSDSLMETCRKLMGRSPGSSLSGGSFEDKGDQSRGSVHGSHELWGLFFRIFLSIYMDKFESAESLMRQFKRLTRKLILPHLIQNLAQFYEGLIAAVLASREYGRQRRARLNRAHKILRKLQSGKVDEEPSMANKIYMLDAQLHVCRGHHETALLLFHKSVDLAELEGFSHEQGLAYELAGQMCEQYQRTVEADLYLCQAKDFYGRWGAFAKVEQLDQHLPVPLEVSIGSSSTNHSS